MGYPLGKSRFLDKKQIFSLKLPIESGDPKTSLETGFKSPKGPMTNKWPRKERVRIRAKTENSFNSLPERYMYLKIILEGVLRHAEIPREIKE